MKSPEGIEGGKGHKGAAKPHQGPVQNHVAAGNKQQPTSKPTSTQVTESKAQQPASEPTTKTGASTTKKNFGSDCWCNIPCYCNGWTDPRRKESTAQQKESTASKATQPQSGAESTQQTASSTTNPPATQPQSGTKSPTQTAASTTNAPATQKKAAAVSELGPGHLLAHLRDLTSHHHKLDSREMEELQKEISEANEEGEHQHQSVWQY